MYMTMEVLLPLSVSFVIGLVISWRVIDHLLMIVHHTPYISKDSYSALYEKLKAEPYFEISKGHNKSASSYNEYTKLHAKHEESAYSRFIHTFKEVSFVVFAAYAVGFVVSMLIFFDLIHILGLALSILVFIVHRKLVLKHDKAFYHLMMHLAVTNDDL